MKNKLILIVAIIYSICLSAIAFASEITTPSYWQRIKNYIAESRIGQWYTAVDSTGRKRLQSVASSGWTGLKRGALIGTMVGGAYGLSRSNASQEDYIVSLITMGLGALAYNVINEAFNAYNKGYLSEDIVVAQIKKIINDKLIAKCRTNEEKRALLDNRDYFIAKFKKAGKTAKELEAQKKLIDQAFDELKTEIK